MPEESKRKREGEEEGGGNEGESSSKTAKKEATAYDIVFGSYANQGLKKMLEDVPVEVPDLSPHGDALSQVRSSFFAVYDGHAGRNAADYCAEHLHVNIASRIAEGASNDAVRKAILDGFRETDKQFLALGHKDGCTALTVTVVRDIMFIAWVGDSKAVLARRNKDDATKVNALPVTKEHTCVIASERERIVKSGGFVHDNRVDGIMEVSRSIGDADLKKHGVISTPGIERITFCARDEFLLLGCDGLWRVFDPKDAVDFCQKRLEGGMQPEKVCMEIVREAIRVREAHDNVTALIVRPISTSG